MAAHLTDLMSTSMDKIRDLVDVNTIVGESIVTPDGVTVIPISKVSFGFASGGADMPDNAKKDSDKNQIKPDGKSGFGGGSGAGVTIKPQAFIVIKPDGDVKLLEMGGKPSAIDGFVDKAPELISNIKNLLKKDNNENSFDEDASDDSDNTSKKKKGLFGKKD